MASRFRHPKSRVGSSSDLKPFFCFYGGKWRAAQKYPVPLHRTIIEPFAGAAGYSTRYSDHNILLYDADPVICGVWEFLIKSSPADILRLPLEVQHVDDLPICQEARWLIGFWLNKGTTGPRLTPSKWMRSGKRPNSFWGGSVRARIARQVSAIKHWRVINEEFASAPDITATWFIDPPYQGKCGKCYRRKFDQFDELGIWCRSRPGQVIVCEQDPAHWLPFTPLATIKTTPGARGKKCSKEMIYYRASN